MRHTVCNLCFRRLSSSARQCFRRYLGKASIARPLCYHHRCLNENPWVTFCYPQQRFLHITSNSLSVAAEKYKKVSPIEHVLLRPDSYVGSTSLTDEQVAYLYDAHDGKMRKQNVRFVPALLKIFDEILVNAADNRQRDPNMKKLTVSVDRKNGAISVYNDGAGIPIEIHPEEKVYIPTLIFGTLLTSSNYDDNESRIVGGRNGFGAKLCNIFSSEFIVETASTQRQKRFKQVWRNHMSLEEEPMVEEDAQAKDFTRVTFKPDLSQFNLSELDQTTFELMRRRTIDVAGTLTGVEVLFNDEKIGYCGFREYISLYELGVESEIPGIAMAPVYCNFSPRWQLAVAPSENGFHHVSFVNNIATTKGGTHVDYIANQIVDALRDEIAKRMRSSKNIRPSIVKSRLFLFVNSFIENPSFESQAKECLTTLPRKFGSKCILPQSFLTQIITQTGIIELILKDLDKRDLKAVNRSVQLLSTTIPKLQDAEDAGSANASSCTLIVTEGDSAKALAVAGLAVLGRAKYGVFPIRGKLINVRGLCEKTAMENAEIAALMRIIGLKFGEDYTMPGKRKALRYGHVMFMTDQDPDGSHIKGLLINFLHFFWPSLLKDNFVQCFATPLLKAKRDSEVISFYSMKEFEQWKAACLQSQKYIIKYYKGLGTSTAREAREYFSQMDRHKIQLLFKGSEDSESIDLVFNKARADDRKQWIKESFLQKEEEQELKEDNNRALDYSTFVNKDLIQYSQHDLERSIPSAVDGLKPSQRKILYTMFQRFGGGEVRVSQLAGAVAQYSCYHHGETSLVDTIVRLAQDFVGSNNINLLQPIGQFGTRLLGGADAASARYIYTSLSPFARAIFPPSDDDILTYREDENTSVEPVWYCPIVPLVLINGAEGIGTGWATKILPRCPRDVIENVRRAINGLSLETMLPFFRNFRGTVTELSENRYEISGVAKLLPSTRKNSSFLEVEISELPAGVWTQKFKERVLDALAKKGVLLDYRERHTENSVCFVVKLLRKHLELLENEPTLRQQLKLVENVTCGSMVLFDDMNILRIFNRVEEIFEMYFETRRRMYEKRREYHIACAQAKSAFCQNQLRFVESIVSGGFSLERKSRSQIMQELVRLGYESNPLKKTKNVCQTKPSDFGYLLDIPLVHLCDEEVAALSQKCETTLSQLNELIRCTWKDLWMRDLDFLSSALDQNLTNC